MLNYRSTPHSTTSVPPAQLLYNRKIQGILPTLHGKPKVVNRHHEAKSNQDLKKEKGRKYANQRRGAKESRIQIGDRVLIKQRRRNKLSTNFGTTPYVIVSANGSRLTAECNGHEITRNASFFKRFNGNMIPDDDHDLEEQQQTATTPENNDMPQEQLLRRSARPRVQTRLYGEPIDSSLIS